MSRNNDYTTDSLLVYFDHQNYYKLIVINLLRQTNTTISQKIDSLDKLEEDNGAAMFFIAELLNCNSELFFRIINRN